MKEDEKLITRICSFLFFPCLITAVSSDDLHGILYIQYFAISFILFYLNVFIIKNINKWYIAAFALLIFNYLTTYILGEFEDIAYTATCIYVFFYVLFLLISELFATKNKQFNVFKWHFQDFYLEIQNFFKEQKQSKLIDIFLYETDILNNPSNLFSGIDELIKAFVNNKKVNQINNMPELYRTFEQWLYYSVLDGPYIYRGTLASPALQRRNFHRTFLRTCVTKGYYTEADEQKILLALDEAIKSNG